MTTPIDMCDLQDVKQWVYGNPRSNKWITDADQMIASYISMASRTVLTCLSRASILAHNVDEIRSGIGGCSFTLRQYPLLGDLTSLFIDGMNIQKRAPLTQPQTQVGGVGWICENPWDGFSAGSPALITLNSRITRNAANIEVKYIAGYAVLSEPATIPSSTPFTIQPMQPYGRYAGNVSVIHAGTLTPFTAIAGGSPTQGNYVAPQPQTTPVTDASWTPQYTFSSSDAGASVLLSYSFTPSDLQQAVSRWVGEWIKYRERIGEKSRALPQGSGTASFDLSAMPDIIKLMVNPYRRVTPN